VHRAQLGKNGDAFVINRKNILQTTPRFSGKLLESPAAPDFSSEVLANVQEVNYKGRATLFATSELTLYIPLSCNWHFNLHHTTLRTEVSIQHFLQVAILNHEPPLKRNWSIASIESRSSATISQAAKGFRASNGWTYPSPCFIANTNSSPSIGWLILACASFIARLPCARYHGRE
jgi:hypothetical protein